MPRTTRRWLPLIVIFLFLQMIFSLGISNILTIRPWKAVFPEGITIGGVDVAGLTCDQALVAVREAIDPRIEAHTLALSDGESIWPVSSTKIGAKPDYAVAVESAFQQLVSPDWGKQVSRGWDFYWKPLDIKMPVTFVPELLSQELEGVAEAYYGASVNASLLWQEEEVVLQPEILGRELDQEATLKRIKETWHWELVEPIVLAERTLQPEIRTEDLAAINRSLGFFTTHFDPSDKTRAHNLKLAVAGLDRILVPSGEEFSFYEKVGARTEERGYQKAKIIINGKIGIGVGGGVCQVSSTLYNVVLQADMEVTERHPHSLPVGYVPVGKDAAVTGTVADFRFRNTSPGPVYILAEIVDNQILIRLLGV